MLRLIVWFVRAEWVSLPAGLPEASAAEQSRKDEQGHLTTGGAPDYAKGQQGLGFTRIRVQQA